MSICPREFKKRALILYSKGFGFQPPGTGITDVFIICFYKKLLNKEELVRLNKISNCRTVNTKIWFYEPYLEIHWTEYGKIKNVFNALLKMNISFRLQNKLRVSFNPITDKKYSETILEQKIINYYRQLEDEYIHSKIIFDGVLFDIWNWKTSDGQIYCKHLRKLKNLPDIDINHSSNYYNWEEFHNIDINTLLPKE
jgi:hypothetical protein